MESLAPGSHLGPYEILSLAGSGGMGDVYKARDTRLDRTVAIKRVKGRFSQRFESEARAIAALNHPNVCALYDVGEHQGSGYLVMEYLEGRPIKGPLPAGKAIEYASAILSALETAHRAGIVHCDLKPANVMLTASGVKLLDFGVARRRSAPVAANTETAPTLALTTEIYGTPQYMAPEQIEGQEPDARSDIFAFGCIFYELLTGRAAFEGNTQAKVIAAVLAADPPPVRTLQPKVSPALARTIDVCLAKDPDERWQDAGDIRRQLAIIAATTTETAPPPSSRSRRYALPIAVALAIAALGLAAWLWSRPVTVAPEVRFGLVQDSAIVPDVPNGGALAVSLDGRRIAFTATREGQRSLWMRTIGDTSAHQVAGTTDGVGPFWSPDGKKLGFVSEKLLKWVDVESGNVQSLAPVRNWRGGAWGRNNEILFAPHNYGALKIISAGGGAVRDATQLSEGHSAHVWPEFLPDGKHFLYTAGYVDDRSSLFASSLDGRAPKEITTHDGNVRFAAGFLLFEQQNRLIARRFSESRLEFSGSPAILADSVYRVVRYGAFAASPDAIAFIRGASENQGLFWLDRAGRLIEATEPANQHFEVSPSNDRVLLLRDGDIWMLDNVRRSTIRVTADAAFQNSLAWSPDGQSIFFTQTPPGAPSSRGAGLSRFSLYRARPDGSGVMAVPRTPEGVFHPTISGDGRFVVYETRASFESPADLWSMPLQGDAAPTALLKTPFGEIHPQVSRDSHWIAYASNETGRYEIYVRRFPSFEGKWRISTAGGTSPRWRADGKELFYLANNGEIHSVTVDYSGDEIRPGEPQPLFRTVLPGNTTTAHFAVSKDGQRFLMQGTDPTRVPQAQVILNWRNSASRPLID